LPLPAGPEISIAPLVSTSAVADAGCHLRRISQLVERGEFAVVAEEAEHGPLAMHRRKRADTDFAAVPRLLDPTLLGDVVFVGEQIGEHLEPGGDRRRATGGNHTHRLQHAVGAEFHVQPAPGRLQVHVARADGVGEVEKNVDGLGGIRDRLRAERMQPALGSPHLLGKIAARARGRRCDRRHGRAGGRRGRSRKATGRRYFHW